ncbi:MAG: tetratricopeptide repeat protein, partial [Elusimicrobia bacterium]|nr:tetratricopeptide repeat protein [Elusimicrobiota bacterium]
FSSDIGFLYSEKVWSAALFMADVNQPDVGLKYTDKLPIMVKLAGAYRIKDLNIGVDTFYKDNRYGISIGGEKTFDTLAVRGSFEFGKDDLRNLAIGFGNKLTDKFSVDYAFLYPFLGIKGSMGTHKVSFGFKFGPTPEDEVADSRGEIGRLTEEIMILEKDLKEMEDENLYINRKLRMMRMTGVEREIEKKKMMREHYLEGLKYYNDGKYNEAIAQFEKILKLEKNHPQSKRLIEQCKVKIDEVSTELYNKGLEEYTKGNFEGAVLLWEKAYELTHEDVKIKDALKKAGEELK